MPPAAEQPAQTFTFPSHRKDGVVDAVEQTSMESRHQMPAQMPQSQVDLRQKPAQREWTVMDAEQPKMALRTRPVTEKCAEAESQHAI